MSEAPRGPYWPPAEWPGVFWMPCRHRSLLLRLFHHG